MERFIQKFPQHVNIKKDDGYTPLHLSALNDHLDVLTALLESVSTSLYCPDTFHCCHIEYFEYSKWIVATKRALMHMHIIEISSTSNRNLILNRRLHVDAYHLRVDDLYSIVYINEVKLKMLPTHVLLDLFRWLSKKINIFWRILIPENCSEVAST